jgi:hypothetical protein
MLLLAMFDDRKIPMETKIAEARQRWFARFKTDANLAEVHSSVLLDGLSEEKFTTRHAEISVASNEHTFFITRI